MYLRGKLFSNSTVVFADRRNVETIREAIPNIRAWLCPVVVKFGASCQNPRQ